MDTKAVRPGTPQPVWWKVAQAVAWIVERNEQSVERAANVHLLRELTGLRPTLIGDELPFSLTAAPAELMRAAAAGHIAVIGRLRGTGQAQRVAAHADYTLEDRKEGPCIVSPAYVGDRFWSDLWIRADECMSKWPGPAVAGDPSQPKEAYEVEKQPASGPHRGRPAKPTPADVMAWYEKRVADHDPTRPPPSRAEDEKAAKKFFGVGGLKELVREARRQKAPADWKEPGPKGRKVKAHAARATATQPGQK